MGLHVQHLLSPSEQNANAGNGGDIIKHSIYLALLDALRERDPWRHALHVVEAHAGKGVYVPAAEAYVRAVEDSTMQRSALGAAQRKAFRPAPHGLGSIEGTQDGKLQAYAASAVLHAFALYDLPEKSLLLMDSDRRVTATLTHVFGEAAFCGFDPPPRVLRTESSSEEVVLDDLKGSCFGEHHVVHLDPFAFVVGEKHEHERERYAKLLCTADMCVASGMLAALSAFVVWGRRHGSRARADLFGAGCGTPGGYHDLRTRIQSERRITVEWCWGQYFATLLAVPASVRDDVIERINGYCKPFERYLETHFEVSA